jgi:hypothetical protein
MNCERQLCNQGRRPCTSTTCGYASPLITANSDASDEASDEPITTPQAAQDRCLIALALFAAVCFLAAWVGVPFLLRMAS